jgi:D-amino-acid oxidase
MWEMSEPSHPASGCFMRIQQEEYYKEEMGPSALDVMPDVCINFLLAAFPSHEIQYRKLEKHELVPGACGGLTFKTVTIDTPVYLQWLMAKFLGSGGQLKRVQVQHIMQAATGAHAREADGVVVCTGLGSRFLGKNHQIFLVDL